MSSQITNDEAIKMANELRDFCRGQRNCVDCPFIGNTSCNLTDEEPPQDWVLPGDEENDG